MSTAETDNAPDEATLFVRHFPKHVHKTFKSFCALSGVPLKDGIEYLMRKAINEGTVIETSPEGKVLHPYVLGD